MTDQTQTPTKACELSPPNSQGPPSNSESSNLTTAAQEQQQYSDLSVSSSSNLNSNGKRTHPNSMQEQGQAQGSKMDPTAKYQDGDTAAAPAAAATVQNSLREKEDVPGWAWKNKKAQDESVKAMELIVDKGRMIGRRYDDPAIRSGTFAV